MKLKTKLASLIIGFVMVASMLFFGVWAASSANVTLGGTISFSSTNVYAEVTGKIEGAATGNETLETLTFSSDANNQPDTSKWANKNLTFDENGGTITISITIKNLASDRKLYASVTDTIGEITNVEKTIVTENADAIVLEPASDSATTDETTVEITMAVKNPDLTIDSTAYGYLVDLKDASAFKSVSDWATEGLTLSVVDGKASVTGYTGSATTLNIPENVSDDNGIYPVTSIGKGAFLGCAPESLSIPASVTSIGINAFADTTLNNVSTPANVNNITIDENNTVYTDGDCGAIIEKSTNALIKGSNSTTNIPEGVTSIGIGAFRGCTTLESVTLPTTVTSIDYDSFVGCTSLKEVYIKATNPPDGIDVEGPWAPFSGCTSLTAIYVPTAYVETYRNDDWWALTSYRNIMVGYDF